MNGAAAAELRAALVDELRRRGLLDDGPIERAFRAVPREAFLPGVPLDDVYRDDAIVTKRADGVPISSSSQPAIMALMLRQLDVRPGMRVLELGAGTGYNAALLRELGGPDGAVTTVDIDAEVAGWARERLVAAGYGAVAVRVADGAGGWQPGAPYDRVILTVGAADIAPAWVAQLREGGLLVLPLALNAGQVSLALEKRDGALVGRSAQPCGFMRMRGALAGALRQVALTPAIGVNLAADAAEVAQLAALVGAAPRREPWPHPMWDGYLPRRALLDARLTVVTVDIPGAFTGGGFGLYDAERASFSAVVSPGYGDAGAEQWTWGADAARDELRAGHAAWQAAGAPEVSALRVSVHPLDDAPQPAAGELAIDTRWWRIIVAG